MKKLISLIFVVISCFAFQVNAYQLQTSKGLVDVEYSNIEGNKSTYSYSVGEYVPVAAATDMICLIASPTRTIKLSRIQVTADATSSTTDDLYIYKRTAANTGGTSTTPALVKAFTDDPTATAVIRQYSANPSALGTGQLLRATHFSVPSTSAPQLTVTPLNWQFGDRASKAPTLKAGTAEQFCLSWNGKVVPAGIAMYFNIEWTEE